VEDSGHWAEYVRRDIGRLADDRLPARRRTARETDVAAVYLGWEYADLPVLGQLAWDFEQFDLALRRASLATSQRLPVARFEETDIRIPRRAGLQLRGANAGSLEILLDIPRWIVAVLASEPVTAVANLIALLGARQAIRVALRRSRLSDQERQRLEELEREPASLPGEPENTPYEELPTEVESISSIEEASQVRQGAISVDVKQALDAAEPIVDVEVGHVRVRSRRPDIDIVIREGDSVTAVSIREPRR
jgi:hypothetical protein